MVTILLEQIIELLKGFIDSFKDHAAEVAEKLGLISEDTSDINDNTDTIVSLDSDIKDNTDILVANTGAIKNSSQTTSVNTAAIASDTTVIRNNINTISTNSGRTAAFTEDTATNTLNILDKVTTIASDTTQIRSVDNNIYSRLNNMENLINWSLYGIDFYMKAIGDNSVIFDTDRDYIDLKALSVEIVATQAGSGTPSPSNPRAISGFSSATIVHNGISESFPFGQTVYGGLADITGGSVVSEWGYFTIPTTANYNTSGGHNYTYNTPTGMIVEGGTHFDLIAEALASNGTLGDKFTMYRINNGVVIGVPDNFTVADYNSQIAGTHLLYPLATPTEITLTAKQIKQIFGANTISTNTNGKVYVTYTESLKFYLED